MAGVSFSKKQQEAINWDNNKELLISAAAGSGKTTVLINRIIDRIVNKRVGINEFLIVTFTHAAANELKERISAALTKAIEENPDDEWLALQFANVGHASIGTMHSFCLKVIKEYHEHPEIMMPKSIHILSEDRARDMLDESVDEIFTDEYALENNTQFEQMLDTFSKFSNDNKPRELVKNLYNFSLNNEDAYQWLNDIIEDNSKSDYIDSVYELNRKIVLQAEVLCTYTAENFDDAESKSSYRSVLLDVAKKFRGYIDAVDLHDYKTANKIINEDIEIKLKGGKVKSDAVIIQKNVLKHIKNSVINFIAIDCDDDEGRNSNINVAIRELCRLCIAVGNRFSEKKRKANSIDYGDMEHMVLRLFRDESIANIYKSKFKHIMFDEYQDCNRLQELIVQKIAGDAKYFMVGDIKQSIYSFRQADPMLFLEKYKKYKYEENAEYAKIDLNENYRSRENILNATNKVFFNVMKSDFCGMEYNHENALNAMAKYPESEKDTFANEPVKVALISGIDTKSSEKFDAEMLYITNAIQEMIGKKHVFDTKSGTYRPIKYSDIAILMRSPKNILKTVREYFAATGIPVSVMQEDDIKYVPEINLLICILRAIENPYNEIALMSLMHCYIFDISDNELCEIMNSSAFASCNLIENIRTYVKIADGIADGDCKRYDISREIFKKLKFFIDKLDEWIENEKYMPIMDFIDMVLEETAYYEFFGAFENGEHRKENIRKLYYAIKQQMDVNHGGLYECIRVLESLDQNGILSESSSGIENSVSVMSIHKSKGLEFPVVFIMDADRAFSNEEINEIVLMHKDYGIMCQKIDIENRLKYKNRKFELLKSVIKREQREEEQRILYVAMTRAKESLIIVGAASKDRLAREYIGESLADIASANDFLTWIVYGIVAEESSIEYPEKIETIGQNAFITNVRNTDYESLWSVNTYNSYFNNENKVSCEICGNEVTLKLLVENIGKKTEYEIKTHKSDSLCNVEDIIKKLSYKYPYEGSTSLNSKLTVSQIKQIEENAFNDDTEIPEYRQLRIKSVSKDKMMTASKIGTLYHFFMQHMSIKFPYTASDFEKDIERMIERRLITNEEAHYLNKNKIFPFLNSEIGKCIAESAIVEREMNFSYNIPATEIYKDIDSNENILVQGVIDCAFIDKNGKYVIVDYKTDAVGDSGERLLVERHKKQVNMYKHAIEDITGIEVAEAYIYSFALDKFIAIN